MHLFSGSFLWITVVLIYINHLILFQSNYAGFVTSFEHSSGFWIGVSSSANQSVFAALDSTEEVWLYLTIVMMSCKLLLTVIIENICQSNKIYSKLQSSKCNIFTRIRTGFIHVVARRGTNPGPLALLSQHPLPCCQMICCSGSTLTRPRQKLGWSYELYARRTKW